MQILKNIFSIFLLFSIYLLLLACLIPFVPPSFWLFDLLAHFQSYYFVLSLLLFLAGLGLWCRKKFRQNPVMQQFLAVSLLALFLSGLSLAPYLPRMQQSLQTDGANRITLLQVNVFKFNRRHEKLLHYIDKYTPDIIMVSEATPDWRDALAPLTTRKDGWPHVIDLAKNGSHGMLILSRHAFTWQETLYPATATHPAVMFRINTGGRDVLLASLHPLSPVTGTRFQQRNLYLDGVAARIMQENTAIVAGDFNTTMYAPSYKTFRRTAGLHDGRHGRGLYPTWPVYLPLPPRYKAENLRIPHPLRIPIDHILYKGELQLLSFGTLPDIDSDHLATQAVFALP